MFVVGPIIVTIFVALRYLMPTKVNPKDIKLSESRFKGIYVVSYLLWIALGVITSYIFYTLLISLFFNAGPDVLYNLYPDSGLWIAVSVLLGITIGTIGMLGILKLLYKEETNDFWAKYNLIYRFNASMLLRGIVIILGISGIGLLVLGSNSKFNISKEKIEVSRLFELSSNEYSMSDIKEINYRLSFTAPNGNVVYRPYYEVVFSSGQSWHTKIDFREPKETDEEAFKYISQISSVDIKVLD